MQKAMGLMLSPMYSPTPKANSWPEGIAASAPCSQESWKWIKPVASLRTASSHDLPGQGEHTLHSPCAAAHLCGYPLLFAASSKSFVCSVQPSSAFVRC